MNIDLYSYNSSDELYGSKGKVDHVFVVNKEKILFFRDEEQFSYLVNKKTAEVQLILDDEFEKRKKNKEYREEKLVSRIREVERINNERDLALNQIQNFLKTIDRAGNFKVTIVISRAKRKLIEEKLEFMTAFDLEFCEVFIDVIEDGRTVNKRYFDIKGDEFSKDFLIKKIKKEIVNSKKILNVEKLNILNGFYQVEFSPKEGGILIHELIGHFSEAHYLSELEKVVTPSKINVVDYSIVDFLDQEVSFPIHYDDLGLLCEDCVLFENGRYKGNLYSVFSGNTVIDNQGQKMIRMRNLAVFSETVDMTGKVIDAPRLLVTETGYAYSSKQGNYEIEILEAVLKTIDNEDVYVRGPLYIRGNVLSAISSIIFCSNELEWNLTRCVKEGYEKFVGNGGSRIVMLGQIYNNKIGI
ncbi:metallopeptidase TldD-related protein [Streptococcus suis]|uniref:metallopeptidase TldD-related protein n=1 Tax=Streptococcus suis TaxID=1307 RepID=UPI0037CF2627